MFVCFYPYCFFKATTKGCFVKNTYNGKYVIWHSGRLHKYFTDKNSLSFNIDLADKELMSFIEEAVSKECCFLQHSSIKPVSPTISLNMVSSIQTDFVRMKSKNSAMLLSLIKQLNIHFENNSIELHDKVAYRILDFPEKSNCATLSPMIYEQYPIQNLSILILSGDVPIPEIKAIYNRFSSIRVIIRVSIYYLIAHMSILDIVANMNNCKLQVVVDEEYNMENIPLLYVDNIDILVPISNVKNVDKFTKIEHNTIFHPIITNENKNSIIPEIKLTYDDIISANISVDELYRRQLINTHIYGTLTIKNNGDVYCACSKIGNYLQENIVNPLYDYLLSENLWYTPRSNKKQCKACLFSEICPPITIYEAENMIDCICSDINT